MKFKDLEIKSVISNSHNLDLGKIYYQRNSIYHLKITNQNEFLFQAKAYSEVRGFENETMICFNETGRIIQYGCDCPYCDGISGCAHVANLIYLFNDLNPEKFPFEYVQKELPTLDINFQTDNADNSFTQLEALKRLREREMELRERRRIELEDYYRQQEVQRMEARYSRTQSIIEFEKTALFESIQPIVSNDYQIEIQDMALERDYYTNISYLSVTLRVGKRKKYVIKNISDFFSDIQEHVYHRYGKDLGFTHSYEAFENNSKNLLFILGKCCQQFNEMNYQRVGKKLYIEESYIDQLFDFLQLNPELCPTITCSSKDSFIQIQIHDHLENYEISLLNPRKKTKLITGIQHFYDFKNQVLQRRVLDEDGRCIRLFKQLQEDDFLVSKESFHDFYRYVLFQCGSFLKIKGKQEFPKIKEETSIQLFADIDEKGMIRIDLDCYIDDEKLQGFCELNEKPPHLEIVEHYISKYADVVDYDAHCAYLDSDVEDTITFIREGLPYLAKYCEIFASQALNQLSNTHSVNLQIGVRVESDLLHIDLESIDIQKDEIYEVLNSYRRKRKYHRLKDGKLLYLECSELEEMDHLMDDLQLHPQDLQSASVAMPLYRSFYLNEQMQNDSNIEYHRQKTFEDFIQNFEKSSQIIEVSLPKPYENVLRDYQKAGYQWMKRLENYRLNGILADDMGLGKTLQVIALLESDKSEERVNIIVTPSSLILNWKDEIEKFSKELSAICIMGNAVVRKDMIRQVQQYDMIITSYDYVKRDIEHYKDMQFHYIILDEAQYIKNQKTKNAISVKMLKGDHRLALTGTPIENSLAELWSIFDFLLPGYLYNYHYFQTHYERAIISDHDEEKQRKLKQLVEPFILRRNKKDVLTELPDKIETTLTISFEEEEKKMYLANLAQVNQDLSEALALERPDRFAILAMLTRLRQICCEPRLLFDGITTPSSKLRGCMELIQSLCENKQRILLFSSFTSMLDLIAEELQKLHIHYLMLTGKTDKVERRELVNRFQNGLGNVFLISLKAGGTGLNLTAAQAVIHYDPWWNVSAQNQATDRAYRIGQTENVTVYKLIMEDSIEKKIQDLQVQKKNLADTFVEGNEGGIQSMQLADIVALFNQ